MSKYDKERQALGMKTSGNYVPTQTSTVSKYQKEREAIRSGTTIEELDRSKFADAENARKEQRLKELDSAPEPDAVETAWKKVEDRKWYTPKVTAIAREFIKLDSKDKQKLAGKLTEDVAKSPAYAFSDAFADTATLGVRPAIQKELFGNQLKDMRGSEEYLQYKKDAKDNNKAASALGTTAGYILPGAVAEKVAATALAPALGTIKSKVAQKAIMGSVTGGGMEMIEGAIRGDNPEELANRTAAGATIGGVLDAALYGAGKGIGKLVDKLKGKKALTEAGAQLAGSLDDVSDLAKQPTGETNQVSQALTQPDAKNVLKPTMEPYNINTLDNVKLNQLASEQGINPNQTKSQLRSALKQVQPETKIEPLTEPLIEPAIPKADDKALSKPLNTLDTNPIGEVKERGFSENIRTDMARPDAERAIFDTQPEFYNVLNNETTLSAAQKRFAQGYDNALKDFDTTKGVLRADNVPLAKLIADEAVKRGDMQTARRVLVDISETLTTAGQYSQAAKILRDSNDPATILTFVEKEIQKLNTQGSNRYGKRWDSIKLTDDELAKIGAMGEGVTDEQKEQLFGELFNSISTRIPTTAREKFDAWRRLAMLFNPKTHIRNVAGNSMMAGLSKVSDVISTTLEKGLKPELRTKSFIANKEYKGLAESYWSANKKALTEGGRWELFGINTPFADKRIFKTGWLETLNDVSKKTLEAEDVMFMKKHFTDNLAGFMQARGLKEPTQEAVEYATKRAQEATFREANALAESINKLKGTKGGLIIEAAIPFTKTPANILTTGTRYSPLGLVNSALQLINKENPAKVIETFSKGLTGTGLTMMGFYMAKNGLARGQYESNAKVEGLKQASSELPNSIIMPQGSYTIDWAQPASLPFFIGVGMAESLKKNDGDYVQAGMDALIAGGDSLINQSMLKNIKDLFSGHGSTTEKVMQLPVNYLQQAFPTAAGQVARITDPLKRQTDYTSSMSRMLTGLQAKTPGASKDLPLKRDILGQPQKYGEGVLNIVQQLISPGYIAKKSDDPIVKELNRLYESEGSDFLPRATVYKFTKDKTDYKLTNEEISEFQRVMGEYTKDKLTALFNSSGYNSLTDAEKAKKIKAINDDGYELAKQAIMKTR